MYVQNKSRVEDRIKADEKTDANKTKPAAGCAEGNEEGQRKDADKL